MEHKHQKALELLYGKGFHPKGASLSKKRRICPKANRQMGVSAPQHYVGNSRRRLCLRLGNPKHSPSALIGTYLSFGRSQISMDCPAGGSGLITAVHHRNLLDAYVLF